MSRHMKFKLDTFIADCQQAIASDKPQEIITQIVNRAISDSEAMFREIGKPTKATIQKIYVSDILTIVNVIWAPKMTLLPHNHNVWAVIGVYEGREDNIFWRRLKGDQEGKIEAAGAKSIASGEVVVLGKNLIHSVTNPTSSFTCAIHVYGGDFFAMERSEWEPLTLVERPYDIEKNLARFENENALLHLRKLG